MIGLFKKFKDGFSKTVSQIAAKTLGLVLNKTDVKQLPRYGLFGSAEQYLDRYSSYYVEQTQTNGQPAKRMEPA